MGEKFSDGLGETRTHFCEISRLLFIFKAVCFRVINRKQNSTQLVYTDYLWEFTELHYCMGLADKVIKVLGSKHSSHIKGHKGSPDLTKVQLS